MKVVAFIVLGLALAYSISFFILEQPQRLQTRTVHERQFKIGAQEWERDLGEIRTFEGRHGLRPEVHSGFRLAMYEWPSWKYLVSVEVRKDGTGRGAILAEPYGGEGETYERPFELEQRETALFLETLDHQIDGF